MDQPYKKIDDVFRESDHQKAVDMNPELWERLERLLDKHPHSSGLTHTTWYIAAALIVLCTTASLFFLKMDDPLQIPNNYVVEDMTFSLVPHFYKEEIQSLGSIYGTPATIILSPSLDSAHQG